MNRRVREWGVYKDMEERVANMATVLPLVNHLHSPAMRDRHWRSLVTVTRKNFDKTPAFALQVITTIAAALRRTIAASQTQEEED
jgi:hypothetical protein